MAPFRTHFLYSAHTAPGSILGNASVKSGAAGNVSLRKNHFTASPPSGRSQASAGDGLAPCHFHPLRQIAETEAGHRNGKSGGQDSLSLPVLFATRRAPAQPPDRRAYGGNVSSCRSANGGQPRDGPVLATASGDRQMEPGRTSRMMPTGWHPFVR